VATFGPLVGGAWLNESSGAGDLRVIDFRWYLDGRSGRAAYDAGHVPGAVFVDLETVTGTAPGQGRHPLPERRVFEAAMREAGVSGSTRVVVYDDSGGFSACRLWWLLRYFGHDSAAVLNGGIAVWPGALSTDRESPPPGAFTASEPRRGMTVDRLALGELPEGSVLLDVRSPERYRGEVEPIDPRAGHIPGARNAPWNGNLGSGGLFRDADELRSRFAGLGSGGGTAVVAYCGSGVSACQTLLALEVAGLAGARLYPGGWSEWSNLPDTPAATGPE
jgi:thiosulfate/3-mercaptopyruvate sulfurtransferase